MSYVFQAAVKKEESSDSDSDSDDEPAAKKAPVVAKPVAKATPQKKKESSDSSDSSEDEKNKSVKPVAKAAVAVKVDLSFNQKNSFKWKKILR